MLDELSKSLTPRLMFLLLSAIAVLIVSTGFSALFKQPIKSFKQQQTRLYSLQQQAPESLYSEQKIAALRQEITALNERLTKTGHEVLKGTTPMKVLADLGELAKQYEVQLLNVAPSDPRASSSYTEVPFSVEVSGSYGQIFKWVYALEHASLPLMIKQFTIQSGTDQQQRKLNLSVSLVQPAVSSTSGEEH